MVDSPAATFHSMSGMDILDHGLFILTTSPSDNAILSPRVSLNHIPAQFAHNSHFVRALPDLNQIECRELNQSRMLNTFLGDVDTELKILSCTS